MFSARTLFRMGIISGLPIKSATTFTSASPLSILSPSRIATSVLIPNWAGRHTVVVGTSTRLGKRCTLYRPRRSIATAIAQRLPSINQAHFSLLDIISPYYGAYFRRERERVVKVRTNWDTGRVDARLVKSGEGNFPEKLLVVKPPVKQLWYRGEWGQTIFDKCVAIVGSRRMSRYGRQAIEEIVPRFCRAGYAIISGLMYGVDQLVHKETLKCGGRAIGILGYGIVRNNEEGADRLAEEIVQSGGIVLSEYSGTTRGQLFTFPQRNRIVVGLADYVVVVEAGLKSGSLNTANWAQRTKKPVYAIPGSIFSVTSEGTNELINQRVAKPLTLLVLDAIVGEQGQGGEKLEMRLGPGERELYAQLEILGPQSINELSRAMNMSAKELLSQLAQMELKGIVAEERGVWKVG